MAQATARPQSRFVSSFGWQVLASMVLGVAVGLLARNLGVEAGQAGYPIAETLKIVGASFVQLLKALVPPLIFTAVVASIANLAELKNAAGLVWRTLLWFALTALIAVVIGLALGAVLQPGLHTAVAATAAQASSTQGSWLDFVKGLVPQNFLGLAASTKLSDGGAATSLSFNVLQILVISIVVGAAALKSGEAGRTFLAFNAATLVVVRKLLSWLIRLTPIGAFALIGAAAASYGWDALSALSRFAFAVYLGLALVLLGVYPVLLAAHGLNPARFFRTAWPAIQLGFVSRSSIGTLPVTEAVTQRLGTPRAYSAFAVPLAATTKMDGCASIYPAVAALFIAQFYGLQLGAADYALIVLVSVLGSAATAGLTGATVMLTLTLSTLGLPLEGVGLLLAIDPILDMGRTAVNVAGQALVPVLVAKETGELDQGAYDGAARPDALPA